jgi:hypothetical protein
LWWSWNMSVDSRFWRLHTNYSYLGTTSSWLIFLLNQQIGILKNVDMSFMGNGNIFYVRYYMVYWYLTIF